MIIMSCTYTAYFRGGDQNKLPLPLQIQTQTTIHRVKVEEYGLQMTKSQDTSMG